MLPKTIDGLIMDVMVDAADRLGNNHKGIIDIESGRIGISLMQTREGQAQALMHELVHLAFYLSEGVPSPDDYEERVCLILGRFLPRVLLDNPDMFAPDRPITSMNILGDHWAVEVCNWPDDLDDETTMIWNRKKMVIRMQGDTLSGLGRMSLFQTMCIFLLQDCGVEDAMSDRVQRMAPQLYAILRANPQAHPRAVMGDE